MLVRVCEGSGCCSGPGEGLQCKMGQRWGVELEHHSNFLFRVLSFLLKLWRAWSWFCWERSRQRNRKYADMLFQDWNKIQTFFLWCSFLVLFCSAMENNKVCCRKLGSELSVFQAREEKLEINSTYEGFWLHFIIFSLGILWQFYITLSCFGNSMFYLFFKKLYKQSYFGKSVHILTACKIIAPDFQFQIFRL